jgi:glycosyltransferase involved in cell wall biosynthesis
MTRQGRPTLLSVNNYYYRRGGAETVFLEQNRMFEEAGWQVVPFAMKHPRNLPSAWSEHFVDEIEFGGDYSLARKLALVPKVIYSREARRKLSRVLDLARPDICHAHNIYHHISPSILGLLRERGVPTVVTLHDLKIACPAYNMLAPDGICERCRGGRLHNVIKHRCIKGSLALSTVVFAESMLHRMLGTWMRDVDRFVVPSAFYVEKFCEWGFPRDRFVHLPNFIDPAHYVPQLQAGRHFLFFGRLSREKGVATLLRAAASAGVPVKIAGTGPQEEELRTLAIELHADAEFLGFLGGASLHDAIRAARAVVLPSEWYENAPMSVLEAYALGKPVVGADIGGIPELVRHGITGMIFESGNNDALARGLRGLAEADDSEIAGMGGAGREWVEREFTARVYQDRLSGLYAALGVAGVAA